MVIQAMRLAFFGALIAGIGVAGGAAAAPATISAEAFPIATDARIGGDESQTRLVVDLSRKIDLHVFSLADPYRIVVDIPQVTFRLPAKAGEAGRGLIKAFRFGLVMPGGSRIVIDLLKPARVEKAFVIDPSDTAPARLVLELAATDRENFLRKIALDQRAHAQAPPLREQQSASGDTRPLIVLDPGHGGIDTGTKGPNGQMEKDIVLDFAKRLKEDLFGSIRQYIGRDNEANDPVAQRAD
jgi:N-acetylmuramoyl-L-alanine amidase